MIAITKKVVILFISIALLSFLPSKNKITRVYLIGDSTMADYTQENDYENKRYPLTGWGQVFQPFLSHDKLPQLKGIIQTDSALVIDKARGGRSTRTFFEEGRWAEVYRALQKKDIVIIQFGHNDASVNKPERYVNVSGYKEYLRLFVNQTRQKGAYPVLLTPVARNYKWENGKISNAHGDYALAVIAVAKELSVPLIDLNELSMRAFEQKGESYVTEHYFMNLPAGKYKAYPEGQKDNTHFQPEGATLIAGLVFDALKNISYK